MNVSLEGWVREGGEGGDRCGVGEGVALLSG